MKRHRILLVDDDLLILKAIALSLKNRGYEVITASNGKDAIDILTERPPDLVITDLVMEGTGGIDVLKKAKEIDNEIMVIILTGYGDLTSAIEALRYKADDYLFKPCEEEEIYFKVAGLIEKKELKIKIRLYENILPVCCMCRKIRDDTGKEHGRGEWLTLERYMKTRAGMDTSHTYCPECKEIFMEELDKECPEN